MKRKKTTVLVIGGGPAGSTVASLLAREGTNVLVVEKDHFPRYRVGESLLPSALQVFDYLGVREKVEAHGFVKKRGAYLRWGKDSTPWAITFGELMGDEGYSYHVVRSEFDKLLLEHSKESGAEVWEGAQVLKVEFEGDRPVSALVDNGKEKVVVHFDTIVDCSGQSGLLATRYLNSRVYHKAFQNVAMWSYWKDAKRLPSPYEGSVLTAAIGNGWIWGIPLHDGSQSIGVVVHKSEFQKLRESMSNDEIYLNAISKCEIASDLVSTAGDRTKLQIIRDYSYSTKNFAGPGYYLCGDAACFLDPVLSSGVHLAMYAGLLAAVSIAATIKTQVTESEAVAFYDGTYGRSFTRFAQFLSSFYNQNKNPDSYFWDAQRITEADFKVEGLKNAFLGLVSGAKDLEGVRGHQSIAEEMENLIAENLSMRKGGVNIRNSNSNAKAAVSSNSAVFEQIEGITGISKEDAVSGLYATIAPELGLARVNAGSSDDSEGAAYA